MGYLLGEDISKHNFKYLDLLLDKIKNNKPVATKNGVENISWTDDLNYIQETKDTTLIKNNGVYTRIFGGYKWTEIDKLQFTQDTRPNNTSKQELCSLEIFKQVNNKEKLDISKLEDIYPELKDRDDWKDSYKAQYSCISDIMQDVKFKGFEHSGGFMKYISDIVKTFGISRKDTWNPADIWLLSEEFGDDFDILYDLSTSKDIYDLNQKMVKYYNNKKIVGVSLKKTSGKAVWNEHNIIKPKIENIELNTINIPLEVQDGNFKNKTTYSTFNNNVRGDVRTNQSKYNHSVSFEFRGAQGSHAQFGKVPVGMLNNLHNKYKIDNIPTWNILSEHQDPLFWVKILERFKMSDLVNTSNYDLDIANIIDTKTPNNSSILQGMIYYNNVLEINNINKYKTEMFYLSQKIGEQFGPFAKLS